MADQKISELTAVTTLNDTDEFVLARSGTTRKITKADLATEVGGTGSATANDVNLIVHMEVFA